MESNTKDKKHWPYDRIREEFTNRIAALLHDLRDASGSVGKDIRTLVIGGGNAEYVEYFTA